MNQKLFFFSLLALFFLYSFYEGDKDPKKQDSKNVTVNDPGKGTLKSAPLFDGIDHSPFHKIVNADSVTKMLKCYKDHPLFKTPGSESFTEYFTLDSADWEYLIAAHKKKAIKSLHFKLGIRNYDQVNGNTAAPVYTIITMPIDKASGVSSAAQAFDYACPCPGSPCCPKE